MGERIFSKSWVVTWIGALQWIELIAGIVEGEAVVFRAMIKGEPRVG